MCLFLLLATWIPENDAGRRDVSAIVRRLTDKNLEVALSAAIELEEVAMQNPKAFVARLPEILKLLPSSSNDVKSSLCQAIKNLDGKTEPHSQLVLDTMLNLMGKKHAGSGVFTSAVWVIESHGKRAAPYLVSIAKRSDSEMKYHALLCLGSLEEEAAEVVGDIQKMLLAAGAADQKFDLSKALIRIDPNNKIAKEKLSHIADEVGNKCRISAAHQLARFPEYRQIVIAALGSISGETSHKVVELVQLQMSLVQLGSDAVRVLKLLDLKAKEVLLEERDGPRGLLAAAIRAQIDPADKAAFAAIRNQRREIEGMLLNKEASIRFMAVQCAAAAIDEEFRQSLSRLRKDRSTVVRQAVARALGE